MQEITRCTYITKVLEHYKTVKRWSAPTPSQSRTSHMKGKTWKRKYQHYFMRTLAVGSRQDNLGIYAQVPLTDCPSIPLSSHGNQIREGGMKEGRGILFSGNLTEQGGAASQRTGCLWECKRLGGEGVGRLERERDTAACQSPSRSKPWVVGWTQPDDMMMTWSMTLGTYL